MHQQMRKFVCQIKPDTFGRLSSIQEDVRLGVPPEREGIYFAVLDWKGKNAHPIPFEQLIDGPLM
jgi:hypothetical protein